MKKIYLLLFLFAMVLTVANAQVAFLLRTANISDLPAENFNSVDQKPEQNAANWFENTYSATDKTVLSIAQVKAGALLAAGEPAFKALWVNVDAVGLSDLNAAGIDNDVVLAIKAYVQAGGNLLLTKQATTLAYSIGRINYAPERRICSRRRYLVYQSAYCHRYQSCRSQRSFCFYRFGNHRHV